MSENRITRVDLWYPGTPDGIDAIEINLMHVRSADDIRISYDFERDGYVIKQAKSRYEQIAPDSYTQVDEWIETAFVQAWPFGVLEFPEA